MEMEARITVFIAPRNECNETSKAVCYKVHQTLYLQVCYAPCCLWDVRDIYCSDNVGVVICAQLHIVMIQIQFICYACIDKESIKLLAQVYSLVPNVMLYKKLERIDGLCVQAASLWLYS